MSNHEWLLRSVNEAEQLGHQHVGPVHVLLALFASGPSAATRTLADASIDPETVRELARTMYSIPGENSSALDVPQQIGLNPAGQHLFGVFEGLALASGRQRPTSEDVLTALLQYENSSRLFQSLGVSSTELLATLRSPAVPAPELSRPTERTRRRGQTVELDRAAIPPVIALLRARHPPSPDGLVWGFNWDSGDPPRGILVAEEGIDLESIVAEASRGQRADNNS